MENQRTYLESLKTKYAIKTYSDWGKITISQIHEAGGGSLISSYYKNSLFACLKSVYPSSFLQITS